jgi:hypothetical protein
VGNRENYTVKGVMIYTLHIVRVIKSKGCDMWWKQELHTKFRVFLDVAPCSHVEVDRRFRGSYCLQHQGNE